VLAQTRSQADLRPCLDPIPDAVHKNPRMLTLAVAARAVLPRASGSAALPTEAPRRFWSPCPESLLCPSRVARFLPP